MRVSQGTASVPDCPASCSYSSSVQTRHSCATVHRLSRRQTKFSRQPSTGGFQICAQQEAARESQAQQPRERPADMAGRPVADNTPYEMPVVNPLLDLPCSAVAARSLNLERARVCVCCSRWTISRLCRSHLLWQALGCTLGTSVSSRAISLLMALHLPSWTAAHCNLQYASSSQTLFLTSLQQSSSASINFTVHAATVRVRPAFAGEGRYFVRVPDGELSPFQPCAGSGALTLRCVNDCTLLIAPALLDTCSSFSQALWHASMDPGKGRPGNLEQHNAEALWHAGTLDPEEAKKLERSLDEAGAAALWGGQSSSCAHDPTT